MPISVGTRPSSFWAKRHWVSRKSIWACSVPRVTWYGASIRSKLKRGSSWGRSMRQGCRLQSNWSSRRCQMRPSWQTNRRTWTPSSRYYAQVTYQGIHLDLPWDETTAVLLRWKCRCGASYHASSNSGRLSKRLPQQTRPNRRKNLPETRHLNLPLWAHKWQPRTKNLQRWLALIQ